MRSGTAAGGEGTPQRRRDPAMVPQAYGWEMADGPGAHSAPTADLPFAEVWTREGLSIRDRRLLLLGALPGSGQADVAELQAGAALGNGELTPEQLDEIALFLCYYVGWPVGTKTNTASGSAATQFRRTQRQNS